MIVKLAPHDYAEATRIAHIRNDGKRGVIRSRKVDSSRDDFEVNRLGALAEIAVAKALGAKVDTQERLNGDGGVDMTLGDLTVQVKYTTHPHGHLLFRSLKDFVTDIAVLVTPMVDKPDCLRIAGWLTRAEFEDRMEVKDFGYGKRVCVGQDDLMPAWLLEGLGAAV